MSWKYLLITDIESVMRVHALFWTKLGWQSIESCITSCLFADVLCTRRGPHWKHRAAPGSAPSWQHPSCCKSLSEGVCMISSAVTLHHSGCVHDMCFIIVCLFIQNALALKEAIVFRPAASVWRSGVLRLCGFSSLVPVDWFRSWGWQGVESVNLPGLWEAGCEQAVRITIFIIFP